MATAYEIIRENLKHNNTIRRRRETVEKQIAKLLKEYFELNEETLTDTENRLTNI